MCGDAACAFSASGLSHFSMTTKVSSPNLAPGKSASTAGSYSMQPFSAWTAGMLAWKCSSTFARMPGFVVMMASTWIIATASPFLFRRLAARSTQPGNPHRLAEAAAGFQRIAVLAMDGGMLRGGQQQPVAPGRAVLRIVLQQALSDFLIVRIVAKPRRGQRDAGGER